MRSQSTCRLWPPPAAHRGPRHDDLGHDADEALHLEDVQAPALGLDPTLVDGPPPSSLGVLVPRAAADALVATGAERPLAVATGALGSRAVAGDQDDADVGGAERVVEHPVEPSTVCGRKTLITFGGSNGTRTQPRSTARGRCVGEVLEAGPPLPGVGVEGLADTGDRLTAARLVGRTCGQLVGRVDGSFPLVVEVGRGARRTGGAGSMRMAKVLRFPAADSLRGTGRCRLEQARRRPNARRHNSAPRSRPRPQRLLAHAAHQYPVVDVVRPAVLGGSAPMHHPQASADQGLLRGPPPPPAPPPSAPARSQRGEPASLARMVGRRRCARGTQSFSRLRPQTCV